MFTANDTGVPTPHDSTAPASSPSPPIPGSADELLEFDRLQRGFGPMFSSVFSDPGAPRTVVVVPSLTLDSDVLARITGFEHYEERLLCLLMLLKLPRTNVVYVTSRALDPVIVDYYLHLLPGIPSSHARRRLTMLSCDDGSPRPLTEKILERPRLVERIRAVITDPGSSHLTCFVSTPLERTLAVRLGIPLYAPDPALSDLGSKSGSRRILRQAGVPVPDGVEDLKHIDDVADAIVGLMNRHAGLRRVLVKLDEGFSGEGNAVLDLTNAGDDRPRWVRQALRTSLRCEAAGEDPESFLAKLAEMGGIVEEFLEGDDVASPSVQCRINPLGGIEVVSTHDQELAGPNGQIFMGCRFPAAGVYRKELHDAGRRVGGALADRGVIGRFGIDFVSVVRADGTRATAAIEINLRKGGTTLPFLMLEFLTAGGYDTDLGEYRTAMGDPRAYYATDNLENPAYRRLTASDLIDIVVEEGLHFDAATQEGVVFHIIGAIAEFGKVGVVAVARTLDEAEERYRRTVDVLDRATADP